MAQERPIRAPKWFQEEPQEGPKRDIGPELAHIPLRGSSRDPPGPLWAAILGLIWPLRGVPGTFPDHSGGRFWDRFGLSKLSPRGQNRLANFQLNLHLQSSRLMAAFRGRPDGPALEIHL